MKYMHTLNNQPASYDGQQICFSTFTQPIRLCRDLRQIKKERKLTIKWRLKQGYVADYAIFGHRRIREDEK